MKTIYLVTQMSGRDIDDLKRYYINTSKELKKVGYNVIYPVLDSEELKGKVLSSGYTNPTITDHAIFERDKWACINADIVYANLIGAKSVSIGSCFELAWASLKNKHTIVAMENDNIHYHSFILEAADIIFETHKEAITYLKNLLRCVYDNKS